MAPCSPFLKDEVIRGRPRAVRRAPTTLGLSGPAGRATARATESVIHGEPAAPAPVLEAEVTGSPSSASSAGGLLPFKGRAGLIPAPGLSTCAQAGDGLAHDTKLSVAGRAPGGSSPPSPSPSPCHPVFQREAAAGEAAAGEGGPAGRQGAALGPSGLPRRGGALRGGGCSAAGR